MFKDFGSGLHPKFFFGCKTINFIFMCQCTGFAMALLVVVEDCLGIWLPRELGGIVQEFVCLSPKNALKRIAASLDSRFFNVLNDPFYRQLQVSWFRVKCTSPLFYNVDNLSQVLHEMASCVSNSEDPMVTVKFLTTNKQALLYGPKRGSTLLENPKTGMQFEVLIAGTWEASVDVRELPEC